MSTETLEDVPPEIPVREYAPPRVPDLCPDDESRAAMTLEAAIDDASERIRKAIAREFAPIPLFPDGAISLIQEAIRRTGLNRRRVRVEWVAEHATVRAFIANVNADDIDAIMEQAIMIMPLGIGIDIQPETP